MSFGASKDQSQVVFTGIFTMVWFGEAICTLNLKLLGGTVYPPSSPSNQKKDIDVVGVSFRVCVFWVIVYFP